jgi:hypothetical protein
MSCHHWRCWILYVIIEQPCQPLFEWMLVLESVMDEIVAALDEVFDSVRASKVSSL